MTQRPFPGWSWRRFVHALTAGAIAGFAFLIAENHLDLTVQRDVAVGVLAHGLRVVVCRGGLLRECRPTRRLAVGLRTSERVASSPEKRTALQHAGRSRLLSTVTNQGHGLHAATVCIAAPTHWMTAPGKSA